MCCGENIVNSYLYHITLHIYFNIDVYDQEKEDNNQLTEFYNKSCIHLIKIKILQHQLYHQLEYKKNVVEIKKDTVNRLQLNYENLLYKQAYLQHEISECKDVKTPNLIEIEKELNLKLGTIVYKDNLNKINEETILVIKQDEIDRVEMSEHLEELQKESELAVNKLDKKRKFNDEFIVKLEPIANAMYTQYAQFDAVVD